MPFVARLDMKRPARIDVDRAATLRDASGEPLDVIVDNLSISGCLITTNLALVEGDSISIGIPGIGARDAWISRVDAPRYGCAFARPITNAEVAAARSANSLIDGIFQGPPASGSETMDALHQEWHLRSRTKVAIIVGASALLWALIGGIGVSLYV
jgi:hypothetical protein